MQLSATTLARDADVPALRQARAGVSFWSTYGGAGGGGGGVSSLGILLDGCGVRFAGGWVTAGRGLVVRLRGRCDAIRYGLGSLGE